MRLHRLWFAMAQSAQVWKQGTGARGRPWQKRRAASIKGDAETPCFCVGVSRARGKGNR